MLFASDCFLFLIYILKQHPNSFFRVGVVDNSPHTPIPDNPNRLKCDCCYFKAAQMWQNIIKAWNDSLSCTCIVRRVKCWAECGSAFMFNNHNGDSTKKGVLFWMQLWEHCSCNFQSCSSVSFWQKPPTLHDSVCVCFCFMDNSSISITQPVFGYESDYRASRYIIHREKTNFAFKKGNPSFLIYLSLHLNISLFALCTFCLHTR